MEVEEELIPSDLNLGTNEVIEDDEFISIIDEEELLTKMDQEPTQVSNAEATNVPLQEEKKIQQDTQTTSSKITTEIEKEPEKHSQESLENTVQKPSEPSATLELVPPSEKKEPPKMPLQTPPKRIEFTKTKTQVIPPSRRPDGTIRKPRLVRADYIPPEEQQIKSLVNKETEKKPDSSSLEPNHATKEKKPVVLPSQPEITAPQALTQTPQIKEEKNLSEFKPEDLLVSAQTFTQNSLSNFLRELGIQQAKTFEREEVESIFQNTSSAILQAIQKSHKAQGTWLIQKIADLYGLKVMIQSDPEEQNDLQSLKKRKVSNE